MVSAGFHLCAGTPGFAKRSCHASLERKRKDMLAVAAAATTATVYLKEDFSGDCARLPLEPGVRCHRVSKPVLPWQGRTAGL